LSNAFGSEKAALSIPVQAQYWSGNAWVQNSADSCTNLPAAAVVRAAYLDNKGAATTAWTSTASAIAISAGAGTLTLGAPSPTATGSLDFALNLGATTTDQSCLAAHPTSTAANLPWLRSQYGSSGACGTAWDRDPSARASFGIYTPETRKNVHVRELF
jgi:MSHA biogenesis protein MshQ